jgi:hypothetical protein
MQGADVPFKIDRLRAMYLVLRTISVALWGGLWITIAGALFDIPQATPVGTMDHRFLAVLISSPILGYIHTIPHPRPTLGKTVTTNLFWSLAQIYVTTAVFGIAVGVGSGGNPLASPLAAGELILFFLLGITINPLALAVAWILSFTNLTVLSKCVALLERKD